ncbi:hypothetical protein KP509_33G008700 [Ceratopteris richardii]|uniref:Uncharacterized protein n=1 Tax=Ceratopteris richardii TaxID=49495 RepID=A0A8T2QLJ5_CERRI|nr:hypothetical protein KP509_33G008700 [Ceratopteris richardii]
MNISKEVFRDAEEVTISQFFMSLSKFANMQIVFLGPLYAMKQGLLPSCSACFLICAWIDNFLQAFQNYVSCSYKSAFFCAWKALEGYTRMLGLKGIYPL